MKTKMNLQFLGLAALMAFSSGAFAHGGEDYRVAPSGPAFNHHPVFQESLALKNEVNERQDKQMDRILNGLYDKRISSAEFRRLMNEQMAIRNMERGFLRDGTLTRFEYQKLDTALDAASRSIFREGHDGQGRAGGWQSGQYHGGWDR